MEKCASCGKKKGMRPCPGLGRRICTLCCGVKRRKQIRCPDDCEILKALGGHRTGEEPADREEAAGGKAEVGDGGSGPERTGAWKAAEWDYSVLVAESMIPGLRTAPGPQERVSVLKRIVSACPEFYPARLDLGFQLICNGGAEAETEEGSRQLMLGVQGLLELGGKDEIAGTLDEWCGNLESRFRFEESMELYKAMLGADPAKAHDGLGFCLAYLGDLDGAARENRLAVEAEPASATYLSNLACAEMQRGNLTEADELLDKALRLDPKDSLALGNMKCLKAMMRKGGPKDWKSFLLRAPDQKTMARLEARDDDEGLEAVAEEHNANLLLAFKAELARRKELSSAQKFDLLFSMTHFAELAGELSDEGPFFLSDLIRVRCGFKDALDRFVVGISDVDREILDEMYGSVREFYGFLAREGAVDKEDYDGLLEEMAEARPGIEARMDRYNDVRKEPGVTVEGKARARRRIFGAGIDWR